MKKIIYGFVLLFIMISLSGCMIMASKVKHYSFNKTIGSKRNTSGGYFDVSILKLGKKNTLVIKDAGFDLEIFSSNYYHENISMGLIFPIFPVSDNRKKVNDRWIKISNNSSKLTIKSLEFEERKNYKIEINCARYPEEGNSTLENSNAINLVICKNEFIWLKVPEKSNFSLNLIQGEIEKCINFEESKSILFWMITV